MAVTHAHANCHHHDAGHLSESKLRLSIGLTFAFVLAEAMAGARAHSLALIADSGHNFTDALAMALSWYAIRIARRPASPTKTFGYHRAGILAALFNAVTLLVIAFVILREAVERFWHPGTVGSLPMIVVAAAAIVLNATIALWVRGEAEHSVNMRSAYVHMAGDALSSFGVVIAGLVIMRTGWTYADPLVSLLISVFIAHSSWDIVVETLNVLLEGTPRGLDLPEMARSIEAVPGVQGVHDLHVWTISDGMRALACHLDVLEAHAASAADVVKAVKAMVAAEYSVNHSTIETECTGCAPDALYCRLDPAAHDHAPRTPD